MMNFTSKKQQYRKQFLISFIAMMPMMSLQAQCPAVDVPYTEDFESAVVPALPDCTSPTILFWPGRIETCSGTENGFTGKFLCFRHASDETTNMMNLMFNTSEINLDAGETYRFSYDSGSNILNGKQIGISAQGADETIFIGSYDVYAQRTSNSVTFTPGYSGSYRFTFSAVQESEEVISEFIVNVDNITIDLAEPPMIADFTFSANCGQSTLLTINGIHFANATVTIGGTPITLATNTASQITANISTAMSGPVVVTTLDGTATSVTDLTFTVAPAIALSGTTSTICAGMASNPVTITTGASGYTAYTWTPSTGVTGNSTSGWVFNPTTATSYVLNASNPTTGCANNLNHAVEIAPSPVAAASLTGNVTITATPAGQTYQWINCTTNASVSGATGATFTATANGSYKVIVTNAGGCKDTSACVNVSKVGLDENNMDIGVSLYPNPTEGNVYVAMEEAEKAVVTVLDALGKVVFKMNNVHNGSVIDMNHTQKGIYLVKVSNAKGTNVFQMVKK